MDVFAFSVFVAILALVAISLAVIGVIVRLAAPAEVRSTLGDASRWLAWLVALTATVGSLLYSEVYHLEPCRLCWFQRVAMYPLALILLVGAIRRDSRVRMYGLPLSIVGLGISIWHYSIQVFPDLEGGSCDPSNPCSARLVEVLGFVSIPFMAGAGFLLISVLLAFFSTHESRSEIT